MAELKDIQQLVHQIRLKRGFTMEPLRIFTLLNEEIGEVATELKKTWSPNYEQFNQEALGEELADVLVCLIALANQFEINLEEVLMDKLIKKDGQRVWQSEKILVDKQKEGE